MHKYLPKSTQTVTGHLHMIQKGICSTPGDKTFEINELINEAMNPDYNEIIRHELPLNQNTK